MRKDLLAVSLAMAALLPTSAFAQGRGGPNTGIFFSPAHKTRVPSGTPMTELERQTHERNVKKWIDDEKHEQATTGVEGNFTKSKREFEERMNAWKKQCQDSDAKDEAKKRAKEQLEQEEQARGARAAQRALNRRMQLQAFKKEQEQLAAIDKVRKSGKTDQAIVMLQSMTSAGSPNAPFVLGTMYLKGDGVKPDKTKALSFFYKSAANGGGNGSYALARAFLEGDGVKKDEQEAIKWLKVSDDPAAQYLLGSMYAEGRGLEKNYQSAWAAFKESALRRDPMAMASLGEMCYLGLGMKKNTVEAKRWLDSASGVENPKALFYLSKMYATGDGVPKDEKLASAFASRYEKSKQKISRGTVEKQIAFKDYDSMESRVERLKKDATPEVTPSPTQAPIAASAALASTTAKTSIEAAEHSQDQSKLPVERKSRGDLYADVEKLVKTFYPKAKLVKTDDKIHFEFKTRKTEYVPGRTTEVPNEGGIVGDIQSTSGKYPGKEYLPAQTNGTFFVSLLMAPYSKSDDTHLLTRLKFPPDAPIDFVDRFKQVVSHYSD